MAKRRTSRRRPAPIVRAPIDREPAIRAGLDAWSRGLGFSAAARAAFDVLGGELRWEERLANGGERYAYDLLDGGVTEQEEAFARVVAEEGPDGAVVSVEDLGRLVEGGLRPLTLDDWPAVARRVAAVRVFLRLAEVQAGIDRDENDDRVDLARISDAIALASAGKDLSGLSEGLLWAAIPVARYRSAADDEALDRLYDAALAVADDRAERKAAAR